MFGATLNSLGAAVSRAVANFVGASTNEGLTLPSIGDTDGNRLVPDHEGNWHEVPAEALRVYGARPVENLVPFSEDNTKNSLWLQVNGVAEADTLELTGTNNSYYFMLISQAESLVGRSFILSADIQRISGADRVDVRVQNTYGTDRSIVGVTLSDGELRRIAIPITFTIDGDISWGIDNRTVTGSAPIKVLFTNVQLEESTGRADVTTPFEYVSSGVGTGPELWTDSPDTVNSGWTDNGDGSYTCDGSNLVFVDEITDPDEIADGGTYLLSFDITDYISGTF